MKSTYNTEERNPDPSETVLVSLLTHIRMSETLTNGMDTMELWEKFLFFNCFSSQIWDFLNNIVKTPILFLYFFTKIFKSSSTPLENKIMICVMILNINIIYISSCISKYPGPKEVMKHIERAKVSDQANIFTLMFYIILNLRSVLNV